MTFAELKAATQDKDFSQFSSDTELCLWQAKVEGWEKAHIIVESLPEPAASWIHAMIHREEGDAGNASYWYYRAGKTMPADSLSYDEEWEQIAKSLLDS
ncbi:hypothetical protein OAB00_03960 [Akkermansiaceae bacterium]|nr:hypothetical protein [Akkermansiaceae bacterium]